MDGKGEGGCYLSPVLSYPIPEEEGDHACKADNPAPSCFLPGSSAGLDPTGRPSLETRGMGSVRFGRGWVWRVVYRGCGKLEEVDTSVLAFLA